MVKTNLNVTIYYDDFEKVDNFHKVLYGGPGFTLFRDKLTSQQSILQNQIEKMDETSSKKVSNFRW